MVNKIKVMTGLEPAKPTNLNYTTSWGYRSLLAAASTIS